MILTSSCGGLVVEQWSNNRLLSATVDRIPLGTMIYIDIRKKKEWISSSVVLLVKIDRYVEGAKRHPIKLSLCTKTLSLFSQTLLNASLKLKP